MSLGTVLISGVYQGGSNEAQCRDGSESDVGNDGLKYLFNG
jgi:hypothetical protein